MRGVTVDASLTHTRPLGKSPTKPPARGLKRGVGRAGYLNCDDRARRPNARYTTRRRRQRRRLPPKQSGALGLFLGRAAGGFFRGLVSVKSLGVVVGQINKGCYYELASNTKTLHNMALTHSLSLESHPAVTVPIKSSLSSQAEHVPGTRIRSIGRRFRNRPRDLDSLLSSRGHAIPSLSAPGIPPLHCACAPRYAQPLCYCGLRGYVCMPGRFWNGWGKGDTHTVQAKILAALGACSTNTHTHTPGL